ncbi:MAG: hypothetical protein A4E26_00916 [Methanobacterium sp. PtaU1.Bin097]|jgi:hypothetical protein|nr:MAG: hypothetical protein A4E26_00916 [Methanobacterium sp. PtaU1.Bin097]
MADWKIICLSGLVSAVLSFLLYLVYFPLFILGPLVGGFLASYFSKVYEEYAGMDRKDGAIMGLLSGIIGSLILNLLLIFGLGAIDNIIGWISTGMGTIADVIIAGYVIFQLSVIACMILGAFGGVVGVIVKK